MIQFVLDERGKPTCLVVGWKRALTLRFCLVKYFSSNSWARWFGCQSLEAFAFRRGSSQQSAYNSYFRRLRWGVRLRRKAHRRGLEPPTT